MAKAHGIIGVCQEGRFRLWTDQGDSKLFVLSPSLAVEPQDLSPLKTSMMRVEVEYEAAKGLVAGKVTALRWADGGES